MNMKSKIELKISFPSEDEASIVLQNDDRDDLFGELLLFARYALQQIANFGGDELSASIASALIDISKNFTKFLTEKDPDSPQLVAGGGGSKMFVVNSQLNGDILDFNLTAKGFGLFGRGLTYYGPISVLLLLKYLSVSRKNDKKYQLALAKITGLVGKSFFDGDMTFENRAVLPFEIVKKCYPGIRNKEY